MIRDPKVLSGPRRIIIIDIRDFPRDFESLYLQEIYMAMKN